MDTTTYGYISTEEKFYTYQFVCQQYGLSPAQRSANLTSDVLSKISSLSENV